MGGADAPGIGARAAGLRVGRAAAPPSVRRRRQAGDVSGLEVGAGAVQACRMAPLAGSVAGDVDDNFHHQLGFTSMTFNVSLVPHLAENDQPVHGWPGHAGASSAPTVLSAAWTRVVVRPMYRRRPWSSYLPSGRLRGAATGPVTAPTAASVASRTLYFIQPLTDGS